MKTRRLGDLEVSAIGLGCMVMPGFYVPGSTEQSIATLHRAAEIGVTLLDTSDAYAFGKNEELVGRATAGRRDDYIIVSKFGQMRSPDGKVAINGRPDYVASACDASLGRLGTDVIDLYIQHRIDPEVPIEDTIGAMADLITAGKVRHIGVSEAAPETIRRAHATHPLAALQTEYSLWSRDAEAEHLPLCQELGIGYMAYSPLGRGIFGGEIEDIDSLDENDRRRDHPRFQGSALRHNLTVLVAPVRAMAAAKGCAPAQIALAWLLHQADSIVPIPGTRRVDHLEANAAALDVALTAADLAALDAACPPGAAEGPRYPAGALKHVNK